MLRVISLFLLLVSPTLVVSAGYEAYSGGEGASSNVEGSSSESKAPAAPVAPPRIPLPADMSSSGGSSLGYRPPPPPLRRDEKSIGQCSFDSSKWQIEPQSAIAHAIMFDRTTGLSCEECLSKCTEFQDSSSQWVCRTLTYDNVWKICDLFAVNGTESPYFLTQYHGRDYFVYLAALPPTDADLTGSKKTEVNAAPVAPTGETKAASSAPAAPSGGEKVVSAPAAPAPTTPAPSGGKPKQPKTAPAAPTSPAKKEPAPKPIAPETTEVKAADKKAEAYQAVHRINVPKSGFSVCGAGEVARYLRFEESERTHPGDEVGYSPAKTLEECAAACDRDEIVSCASAVFSPSGCELSSTVANHSNAGDLAPSKNAIYLEKMCIPEKLAKKTKLIFNAVANYVMVGHVQEVADAKTLTQCNIACLQAEKDYGFICKSAMWYPVDESQNCLLNTQSRKTLPDVFIPEDQGVNMVYYEVAFENEFDFNANGLNSRFRDDPLSESTDSKYTRWSKCNNDLTGMRHRYLKCKEQKDVRKCPKETVMCRHLPVIQIQKIEKPECHAVLDSQGRKRCPHGVRMINGRREYCRDPVDC